MLILIWECEPGSTLDAEEHDRYRMSDVMKRARFVAMTTHRCALILNNQIIWRSPKPSRRQRTRSAA